MSIIVGIKCQKCGFDTIECEHFENGGYTAYNDNYKHACKNPKCGHVEESLDHHGEQVG